MAACPAIRIMATTIREVGQSHAIENPVPAPSARAVLMAIFRANQKRGSWVAELLDGHNHLGVPADDPFLAVLIDDEESHIDWKTGRYVSRQASTGPGNVLPDWWNSPSHDEWRRLLREGRPVLLRKGMDWETRTAGPKIGFFSIAEPEFDKPQFSVRLTGRLGSCD